MGYVSYQVPFRCDREPLTDVDAAGRPARDWILVQFLNNIASKKLKYSVKKLTMRTLYQSTETTEKEVKRSQPRHITRICGLDVCFGTLNLSRRQSLRLFKGILQDESFCGNPLGIPKPWKGKSGMRDPLITE